MKIMLKKLLAVTAVVCFVLLGLMMFPGFYIKEININDLKNITKQEVYFACGLGEKNVNLLAFNSIKAQNELEKNPFVYKVSFKRKLPNTLNIEIIERTTRFYIPYMDKFLYMDGDGRVLKIAPNYTESLPVVAGINFTSFQLGNLLDAENKESFNVIVELSKLMKHYDILEKVYKVDVSDTDDIHMYSGDIDILFGSFEEANLKVSRIKPILEQLESNSKGFLHLEYPEQPPVFEFMK